MTTLTDVPGLEIAARPVLAIRSKSEPAATLEGLPLLTPTGESTRDRRWWFCVMLIAAALYAYMTFTFFAPADGGVDQNAYLVGGRLLAEHGTDRFTLPNPYAYVGGMMVRISPVNVLGGDYYPKYPVGLPLLYAMFFWGFKFAAMLPWVGGHVNPELASVWAFGVSPGSAVLAFVGTFLLGRAIAGSFAGMLASILLATSRLTMELSIDAKSHSADMAVVVWGMFLLVRWWQTGAIWRGVLAGLLLGYSTSIRYTEGLMVLPILIACASRFRAGHVKRSFGAAAAFGLLACCSIACLGLGLFRMIPALTPGKYAPFIASEHHPLEMMISGAALLVIGAATAGTAFLVSRRERQTALLWGSVPSKVWAGAIGGLVLIAVYSRVAELMPFGWWQNILGAGLILAGLAGLAATGLVARRENWMPTARELVPLIAWGLPVAALAVFNLSTMGTLTGYDSTNESEGFQLSKFFDTFEHMFRTYYTYATYFVMPLSLLGVGVLFRKNWKLALVFLAWVLPSSALYAAYYWSPDSNGNAYARFFLSFVPAVMLAAAFFLADWARAPEISGPGRQPGRQWIRTLVVGVVVAVSASLPAYEMCYGFQSGMKEGRGRGGFGGGGAMQSNTIAEDNRNRVNLAEIGNLASRVPAESVLFVANGGRGMGGIDNALNYIQFLKPWNLFQSDAFEAPRNNDDNGMGFGGRGGGGGGGRNNRGGGRGNQPTDPNNVIGAQPQQYLQTEYRSRIHSERVTGVYPTLVNLVKDEADLKREETKSPARKTEIADLIKKDDALINAGIEDLIQKDFVKSTADEMLGSFRSKRLTPAAAIDRIVQREFDLQESDMLANEMAAGHGVWILATTTQIESIESQITSRINLRYDGPAGQKPKYDWETQGLWTDLPAMTAVGSWTDQKLFSFLGPKSDPMAIPDAKQIAEENASNSGRRTSHSSLLGSFTSRRVGGRRNGGGGGGGFGGPPGMGGDNETGSTTLWELVRLVPAKAGAKPAHAPTPPPDDLDNMGR